MPARLLRPALVLSLLALGLGGCASEIADRVKRSAQRGAEDAASREAYTRANRAVTGAIQCVAGDRACVESAEADGRDVVLVDEDGTPLPDSQQPAGSVGATNANYDFTPGSRVLFADDFSRDNVGDFPRRLDFRSGTMEILDTGSGRILNVKTRGAFDVTLPETLPETFTLELDVQMNDFTNGFWIYPVDAEGERVGANYVQIDTYGGTGVGSFERGGIAAVQSVREYDERTFTLRVMADGSYVKVFVDRERVANVPNADLGRASRLRFDFNDVRENPVYVGDLRVAAGGRDLYDQLTSEGSLTLGGVEFETGSAQLRGASAETLGRVAQMLREHGDLRLRVEGHTDDTGSAAGNERLSQQRAEAVRAFLVERGVDAGRLAAVGVGPSQPVASNATAEGRQRNRRVVLVRL